MTRMAAPVRSRKRGAIQAAPRIVCVIGPTASGKTALGIRIAKRFKGEIVNADSRQVYKEIRIGTGTPPGKRGTYQGRRAYLVEGVPHYLMYFLDPRETFTVVEWREKALKAIRGIAERGHLPIIVGGNGLYISSLVDNYLFPRIEPNPTFRTEMAKKPLSELATLLTRLDPTAIQAVDLKNPRRVIRALEVVTFTGRPFSEQKVRGQAVVDAFQVGMWWNRETLYARNDATVEQMIKDGWVEEIRGALQKGIPEDAPAMISIGYRELLKYVEGKTTLLEAIRRTQQAVHRYAKRQLTWFKRDPRIHWARTQDEAVRMVGEWMKAGS